MQLIISRFHQVSEYTNFNIMAIVELTQYLNYTIKKKFIYMIFINWTYWGNTEMFIKIFQTKCRMQNFYILLIIKPNYNIALNKSTLIMHYLINTICVSLFQKKLILIYSSVQKMPKWPRIHFVYQLTEVHILINKC